MQTKHLRYHEYDSDTSALSAENSIISLLTPSSLYTDTEFPPSGSSLYKNEYEPPLGYLPADLVTWNRVSKLEIQSCMNPVTISSPAMNKVVTQGCLKNNYFINALTSIVNSTNESLLSNLIVSDLNKEKGIYTVKFYINCAWVYVHVDENVPCTKTGRPYFSHSGDANEVYVMIIEKAFAKLKGTYEQLNYGSYTDCLTMLTGHGTVNYDLNSPICVTMRETGVLFQVVKSYIEGEGQLVTISSNSSSSSDLGKTKSGFIPNKLYVITDVLELHADATPKMDSLDVKLVRVTNTQGRTSPGWKGAWSKDSGLWNDYASIAKIVGRRDKSKHHEGHEGDDGGGHFWITWEDLIEVNDSLYVAYNLPGITADNAAEADADDDDNDNSKAVANVPKKKHRGNWTYPSLLNNASGPPPVTLEESKTRTEDGESDSDFCRNPQFVINVANTGKYCVTLSREIDTSTAHADANANTTTTEQSKGKTLGFTVFPLLGLTSRLIKYKPSLIVDSESSGCINVTNTNQLTQVYNLNVGRYTCVCYGIGGVEGEGGFALEVSGGGEDDFEGEGEGGGDDEVDGVGKTVAGDGVDGGIDVTSDTEDDFTNARQKFSAPPIASVSSSTTGASASNGAVDVEDEGRGMQGLMRMISEISTNVNSIKCDIEVLEGKCEAAEGKLKSL